MSSGRRLFESEDDYHSRIEREANEAAIEEATGSSPSRKFLESEEDYVSRIGIEAREHAFERETGEEPKKKLLETEEEYHRRLKSEVSEATLENLIEHYDGELPKKGFFESEDDYWQRVQDEATDRTIEYFEIRKPKQGILESDEEYASRLQQIADEYVLEDMSGEKPGQKWLEDQEAYRNRIHHEANIARRNIPKQDGSQYCDQNTAEYDYESDSSSYTTPFARAEAKPKKPSAPFSFGFFWAVALFGLAVSFWIAPGVGFFVWINQQPNVSVLLTIIPSIFTALLGPIFWMMGDGIDFMHCQDFTFTNCYPLLAWSKKTAWVLWIVFVLPLSFYVAKE